MLKATTLLVFIALFTLGCNKSDSTKDDSSGEGETATPAKTEEMLLVDKELNLISLNAHDSYEYCKAKDQINSLDKMVSTEQGRMYVKEKQKNSMEILRRHLDEITSKEANMYIDQQSIYDAAIRQAAAAYPGWDIVTADAEKTSESNNDGIFTASITYRYTVKKSGGLFSSDKYASPKVRGTAKYVLRCKGNSDPVTYSAQLLK